MASEHKLQSLEATLRNKDISIAKCYNSMINYLIDFSCLSGECLVVVVSERQEPGECGTSS